MTLAEPLLPTTAASTSQSLIGRIVDHARRLPTAAFLTVLADVTAASFGSLLLPAATGFPASAGVHLYLLSIVVGQLAACTFSHFPFATAGATLELVPLLVPITRLIDPALPDAARASTLLAMYSMTSALVGLLHTCVSRLKLGGLFRCIPLIVLKAALTGIGLYMLIEGFKTGSGVAGEAAPAEVLADHGALLRIGTTAALIGGLALAQRLFHSPISAVLCLTAASLVAHAVRRRLSRCRSPPLATAPLATAPLATAP